MLRLLGSWDAFKLSSVGIFPELRDVGGFPFPPPPVGSIVPTEAALENCPAKLLLRGPMEGESVGNCMRRRAGSAFPDGDYASQEFPTSECELSANAGLALLRNRSIALVSDDPLSVAPSSS